MSVTVFIPSPLRQFTGNTHSVQAEGGTVAAVLAGVVADHPALGDHLFTPGEVKKLQPFVHVFVGGKDIAGLAGLDTPLADGSELLIVQAISGG